MGKVDYKKEKIPFTQIANGVIYDKNLSAKAKGVYCYLYAKPDGWDFSAKRIQEDFTDGRKAINSALQELEENGYLERNRRPDGRVVYYIKYPPTQSPQTGHRVPDPKSPNGKVPKRQSAEMGHISNKDIKEIKNLRNKEYSVQNQNAPEVHGVPFEDFWKLYPVKQNKKKASEKWTKLTNEEQHLAFADMQTRPSQDNDWVRGYAPHATTYLNGARWEDQYQKIKSTNNNKVHRL